MERGTEGYGAEGPSRCARLARARSALRACALVSIPALLVAAFVYDGLLYGSMLGLFLVLGAGVALSVALLVAYLACSAKLASDEKRLGIVASPAPRCALLVWLAFLLAGGACYVAPNVWRACQVAQEMAAAREAALAFGEKFAELGYSVETSQSTKPCYDTIWTVEVHPDGDADVTVALEVAPSGAIREVEYAFEKVDARGAAADRQALLASAQSQIEQLNADLLAVGATGTLDAVVTTTALPEEFTEKFAADFDYEYFSGYGTSDAYESKLSVIGECSTYGDKDDYEKHGLSEIALTVRDYEVCLLHGEAAVAQAAAARAAGG